MGIIGAISVAQLLRLPIKEKVTKCEKTMATLINEDTLNRMFNDNLAKKHHKQTGWCYYCGSDVTIKIEKTSSGYGFQGGVLYVEAPEQFLIACEHCFKNNGNLKSI